MGHYCLVQFLVSKSFACIPDTTANVGTYLLLKKHGVDGLPTGQDHHGESHGHRHHESHSNPTRYQIGWEVHKNVSGNVLCEADVAKETHLAQKKGNKRVWGKVLFGCVTPSGGSCVCFSAHGDVENGDNVESWAENGAHAFDRRLIQAIVGREHLPARDKWANNKTVCCVTEENTSAAACMWQIDHQTHKCYIGRWGDINVLILVTALFF